MSTFLGIDVGGALRKIATKILDSGVPDNHVTVVKEQFNAGLTANPVPYNIHIEWHQESTYRVIDKKDLSTGWPFLPKGSPPR